MQWAHENIRVMIAKGYFQEPHEKNIRQSIATTTPICLWRKYLNGYENLIASVIRNTLLIKE